jgi:hypothetical protein
MSWVSTFDQSILWPARSAVRGRASETAHINMNATRASSKTAFISF